MKSSHKKSHSRAQLGFQQENGDRGRQPRGWRSKERSQNRSLARDSLADGRWDGSKGEPGLARTGEPPLAYGLGSITRQEISEA